MFRDFPTFSVHLHLLSSDLFSSDSSHLCFSIVHIVGSFTSKLPSISYTTIVHSAVGIHAMPKTWAKSCYEGIIRVSY